MADDLALKQGDEVPPKLKQWYRVDREKADDWREQAKEDFDFVAGRQFTDAEIKALEKKRRPTVVFNRVAVIVDAVTGYEIGNRREVRYIPREMGDVAPNEVLTAGGQWFNDQSGGDFVRSAVFADTIVCGMGWSESRIDYSESPEGAPTQDHLDAFEMAWDRDARQRNLKDARRVWRARRIPLSEAMDMWPGYTKAELDASWSNVSSPADLKRSGPEGTTDHDEYVTVVQCQYQTRQTYYLAQDPMTGQESEFSEEEFTTANKRLKQLAGFEMEGVRFRKKVIKQAFLGKIVLAYGDAPCPDEFSLQCVTGKFDRNKGTWYGLVRAMKDPQRWANKWLAQLMFIMNTNSKGGLMLEKRALDGTSAREVEETWAQSDAVTVFADGALSSNAVKEKAQAPFPAGFQELTNRAIDAIREVSGVSLEMLGTREADQPIGLEASRKQAGLNILQWAFDGMKLYSERQGKVVLHYLKNDLSDGRLIRIVGKDNEKYVPLVKQADAEYDIIVDDAPTSPNQKEQIWAIVSSFMPLVGKVIPPQYILKALKFSPLPASVVAELEEMAKAPNPEAEKAKALAAQTAAAEADKIASEAMLNKAKAQSEGSKGQVEQIKAQAAQQDAANTMQQGQMEMAVSRAEFEQEMQAIELKRVADREKHEADMQKMAGQLALANAKANAARKSME
jgi:hypothetical protein